MGVSLYQDPLADINTNIATKGHIPLQRHVSGHAGSVVIEAKNKMGLIISTKEKARHYSLAGEERWLALFSSIFMLGISEDRH